MVTLPGPVVWHTPFVQVKPRPPGSCVAHGVKVIDMYAEPNWLGINEDDAVM